VEEDLHNSYLIEEYLEGESLFALVKRLGSLSIKTAMDIGVQICRLIQFMNTADNPILYLDLQPKNLLVCEGKVRLIDFDHAQYAEDVLTFGERYGTIGFAAPEQYLGEALDCRTDVYAIGALLYFMCRGEAPGKEFTLGTTGETWEIDRIIRGCMAMKKEERYQNAGEVEHALSEQRAGISKEHAIESLNIVFAGAKQGIGTTHAALGMSGFLTRNGYPALYQEDWDTDAVRTLARNTKAKADSAGIYHVKSIGIRPFYGKTVKLPYRYYPVVVKDVGTSWQQNNELPDADFYVLVCGGKWWETDHTLRAARHLKDRGRVLLLFNHMAEGFALRLPEDLEELPCFYLPFSASPFEKDRALDACYGEILETGLSGRKGWRKREKGWKFWKKSRGL